MHEYDNDDDSRNERDSCYKKGMVKLLGPEALVNSPEGLRSNDPNRRMSRMSYLPLGGWLNGSDPVVPTDRGR